MTLGIAAIGTATGSAVIDNMGRAALFDRSPEFIAEKIGFLELRRLGDTQTVLDLCREAVEDLQLVAPFDMADVDCLVVVTQNPAFGGLPHTAAHMHGLLGLSLNCAAFDISLGCSGYVYALDIVTGFMEKTGLRQGLIITADPYSAILDHEDVNTELLFGDAATCTLISAAPTYVVGKSVLATDGKSVDALRISRESGKLHMDGRGIFNFAMRMAPAQIHDCLRINGVALDAVDYVLLHQASRYIVENIARRLGAPPEKAPFCLADTGNTVSSTLPFVLRRLWDANPATVALSGFGVGLSLGTTVLFNTRG